MLARSTTALTSLAFMSACAVAEPIRVASVGPLEGPSLNDYSNDSTVFLLHHVIEPLIAYDDQLNTVPFLAERVEISDDGKTYTFTLRDDIQFHNGEALTAEIAAWNFKRFTEPEMAWDEECIENLDGSAEGYHRAARIVAVDVLDERTFSVELQSRNVLFPDFLALHECNAGLVHPDSFDADGNWVTPIGTGPFRAPLEQNGGSLTLERFDGYSPRSEAASGYAGNRSAAVDTLSVISFDNADDALGALRSGEVDIVVDVPTRLATAIDTDGKFEIMMQQTPAWHQLIIQTRKDPLLANADLRRAIDLAIDEAEITRRVLGAAAEANPSAVYMHSPYFNDSQREGLGYDPEAARQLLREIGYAGDPITIQASDDPYPMFLQVATVAAEMMQDVGLNAAVEKVSWPDQDGNYVDNNYQMTSMTFSTRTDPTLLMSTLAGQKSDHSWYLWEDTEAAALTAYSAIIEDGPERQQVFDNIHARMIETAPTLGIFNYPRYHAVASNVEGFSTWATGTPRFWGVSKPASRD